MMAVHLGGAASARRRGCQSGVASLAPGSLKTGQSPGKRAPGQENHLHPAADTSYILATK